MKKIVFFLCCFVATAHAQEHAWVYFKDKPDTAKFLLLPNLMLTQKAIDRRNKQNIAIVENDVPLCPDYVSQIASSTGISVKARSKWLNALHVIGSQQNIEKLNDFSFVETVEFANKSLNNTTATITKNRANSLR